MEINVEQEDIISVADLKQGDEFRCINSDEKDTHLVLEVKEKEIRYSAGLKPQTASREFPVNVIKISKV